ncbi:MAG: type II toxin-antitoxin system HicA family toxin [Pseudomonadota bacterium]
MTKIAKLHAWVLANPRSSIAFRDFERLLLAFGFVHVRTTGSHRQFRHPSVPYILSIQPRGNQAKSYQIGQFLAICEAFELELSE